MKQNVIVIGGGIAGLSAGIYAQRCGFEVTVLESHSIAGGNCTSWKRGGYLFEGGMHWLAGSHRSEDLNALWRYVGGLDDDVNIHCGEPFMEYDHFGTPIRFYRDVDATERYLTGLSPADAGEIKKLCDNIRKVNSLSMPVTDLRGVKVTRKRRLPLSLLFSALSAMRLIRSFANVTRDEYVSRFSHEGLREAIRSSTFDKVGVAPFFFTLGSLARGDGGFPEGGSLPFVKRMVDTFTTLGGTILYNTRADRVVIENGKAAGVIVSDNRSDNKNRTDNKNQLDNDKCIDNNKRLDADAVIIAADTMNIDHLFESPPKAKWLSEMKASTEPTMATFICLGINADLTNFNHFFVFKLKTPIVLANQTHEYLRVSNYAGDPVYSPDGKSALTMQLPGDTYDFWKRAKEEGRYEDEKRKIADAVIAAIAAHIPQTDGQVEVCDVATPLTYERYCANWKGSWMTDMTADMKMKTYPAAVKGLDRVYFAGHRLMPPGGLPAALMTGRAAVQYLCRDTKTVFVSEE